jgi:hypothetical protein
MFSISFLIGLHLGIKGTYLCVLFRIYYFFLQGVIVVVGHNIGDKYRCFCGICKMLFFLAVGYWLLAFGCWLLAVSFWLLAVVS